MREPPIKTSAQRGFSLIELMVGMVLALIAVIVVMQIFQQSERSKRTTTSGDAASMDGAIGFTDLQRDLRQGGMGISNLQELGCKLTLPLGGTLDNLGPVTVNPPGLPPRDANTDSLLIVYGSGNSSPEGDRISSKTGTTALNVKTPPAFTVNNYVVAALQTQPAACSLVLDKVVSIPNTAPDKPVNVSTGTAAAVDTLYDWGATPRVMAYRVYEGRLKQCDFMLHDCTTTDQGVWLDLIDGVVSLRAEYGRDTSNAMNGQVDTYDQTTPTTACGWARTEVVKLALTMRNGQLETKAVTGTDAGLVPPPTWSGAATAPIDVTGNAQWALYRYKVYESVVPMRNMAWIGAQASCLGKF